MEVLGWLLLSLLTVQAVTSQDLHRHHRDFRDARGIQESELEDWIDLPRTLARDHLQSEFEDWDLPRAHKTKSVEEGADRCGIPRIAPSASVRVVGGLEAVPHSWPWQVSLQVAGRHFCGGSLINSQWVVSAAHCAQGRGVEVEVVIGLHRRSQPDSYTVRVPVADTIINKKFNSPMSPSASFGTSDIMLLKLAHPVQFNDAVSPVCLPSLFQVLPANKPCYTSGWGQLSTHGDAPDELMQVMLPLLDRETCNQPDWHNNSVDDSMVCAGYEEGERGSCYGDSGGPLVCQEEGRWLLYGVVSWGSRRGCAAVRGPTVYNRASAYIRWIERTISEHSI